MSYDQACAEELKRLRAEADTAADSIDRLTYDMERAFWDLAARVGLHRASEIATAMIPPAYGQRTDTEAAREIGILPTLEMCEDKIVAGEGTTWMEEYYGKYYRLFPWLPTLEELKRKNKAAQ